MDEFIPEEPKVKLANLDFGVITHHPTGRVLIPELKQVGESLGNLITLDDLAGVGPKQTVVVIENSGDTTEIGAFLFDPVRIRIWRSGWREDADWQKCDIKQFRNYLRAWWYGANFGDLQ